MHDVNQEFKVKLTNFHELYQWSCEFPESFWSLFWKYSSIIAERNPTEVLKNGDDFFDSQWFPEAKLNFANNLFFIFVPIWQVWEFVKIEADISSLYFYL